MKRFLLILSLLGLALSPLSAQHRWARQTTGGTVRPHDMATDPQGNMLVIGNFSSTISWGDYTLVEDGSVDDDGPCFLVKYQADGEVEWASPIKGKSSNNAWGVSMDALGNAYVCGEYEQTNSFTELNFGGGLVLNGNDSQSLFLAKADESGNFVWATSILASTGNGEQFLTPQDLVVAGEYVYLTGKVKAPVTIEGTTYNGANTTNHNQLFIAKYDTSGNLIWFKHTDQTNDFGNADGKHIYWRNNKLYVIGDYSNHPLLWGSDSIHTAPLSSNRHLFIGCFDTDGNLLWHEWAASFGSADQEGLPVGFDAQGNLYTSIRTSGYTELSDTSFQAEVGQHLVKFGPNGNRLFTRKLYEFASGSFPSVLVDAVHTLPNGNTFVLGTFGNADLIFGPATVPFTPGSFSIHNYLAAFNADGIPLDGHLWADEYLGSFFDFEMRSFLSDPQGNLYTLGRIKDGLARIDTDTLDDRLGMFLVKTDPTGFFDLSTSIGDVRLHQTDFQLYPNPASHTLMLRSAYPLAGDIRLQLLDMQGRSVLTQSIQLSPNQSHAIDLSGLPKGVYLARIEHEQGLPHVSKLLIE